MSTLDPEAITTELHPEAMLYAQTLVEKTPRFSGYQISSKLCGRDPGFILSSPENHPQGKRKYFCKHTENPFWEYFFATALSSLGVKMPETELIIDRENPAKTLFITLDLSRDYSQNTKRKQKKFQTIGNTLQGWISYYNQPGGVQPSAIKQIKELKTFLDRIDTEKTRVSFAKLLILATVFKLGDVFSQSQNIGCVETESHDIITDANANYLKFGIVDFNNFNKKAPIFSSTDSLKKRMDAESKGWDPVFQRIYGKLTPGDFQLAAQQLKMPKKRILSKEDTSQGMLLVSKNSQDESESFQQILEKNATAVIAEIRSGLKPEDAEPRCSRITADCKAACIALECAIEELLIPPPEEDLISQGTVQEPDLETIFALFEDTASKGGDIQQLDTVVENFSPEKTRECLGETRFYDMILSHTINLYIKSSSMNTRGTLLSPLFTMLGKLQSNEVSNFLQSFITLASSKSYKSKIIPYLMGEVIDIFFEKLNSEQILEILQNNNPFVLPYVMLGENVTAIRALGKLGVNPNEYYEIYDPVFKITKRMTLLQIAAEYRRTESTRIFQELLELKEPRIADCSGMTTLHFAFDQDKASADPGPKNTDGKAAPEIATVMKFGP